jgi:hypothetical protein
MPENEKACRGRRCGRLLNLIGNWEEEEITDLIWRRWEEECAASMLNI